ncbi:M14 family metallopeptidase [Sporosarcina sp. P21c]|uniref:M14 family metallopeptidase n=1 Tax=Sporosarcina sp. P21c TaxID=2048255 RepID=UPI00130435E0|nr:M14 family metallopeptidase [Sporosarcina sp. P21c]
MKYRTIGTGLGRDSRNAINDNFKDVDIDIKNIEKRYEGIETSVGLALLDAISAKTTAEEAKTTADGISATASEAKTKAEAAEANSLVAKTTAETVRGEFDQVVAEAGSNNPEVVQARGNYTNLNQRLDSTAQQLADTAVFAPEPTAYWISPPQRAARTDEPNYFTNAFQHTAENYLNDLFEPLRAANPNYITRKNLGKDQSGLYDVWRYDWTPEKYEKTIIVTAGLHGSEIQGVLSLYLFMKEVCENWKNDAQLAYIRNKVRVISIPMVNPWGLSQLPTKKRENSNGVNINRNFDYRFLLQGSTSPTSVDYRGASAFSEVETRYVRDLVLDNLDAVAYLDFHVLSAGSGYKALAYVPRSLDFSDKPLLNFFKRFAGDNYSLIMQENAFSHNWVAANTGLQATTPEFTTGAFGTRQFDAVEMTKGTEYFGNVILQMSKLEQKITDTAKFQPFTKQFVYTGTASKKLTVVGDDSYIDIPELRSKFNVPCRGIVTVSGSVMVRATDGASVNFLAPTIGQTGGVREPNVLSGLTTIFGGAERHNIPINNALPVLATTGGGIGQVEIGLRLRASSGSLDVYRYNIVVTFTPSDSSSSFELFDATGNEGSGTGAMKKIMTGLKATPTQ